MNHLASTLLGMLRDGDLSPETVKGWRATTLEKLAKNSGQTIQNASGHGIAFTAANGLTWDQWLAILTTVLRAHTRHVSTADRSRARF